MKLYHYTSYRNFKKIVTDNVFLLSNFINANDYKEKVTRQFQNKEISDFNYLSGCAENRQEDNMPLMAFANSMMWHFYADRYCGVCIEIDLDILSQEQKGNILKQGFILYRDGVTHIDNQTILDYLMEKRKCWSGENEYRLIFDKLVSRISNITNYITAIYWGIGVDSIKVQEISLPEHIRQFKMFIDSLDGRLNRIELKLGML